MSKKTKLSHQSKYGGKEDKDVVRNDILGISTVKEIKEAEEMGAIVFQDGVWKIRSQRKVNASGQFVWGVSDCYVHFMKKRNSGSHDNTEFLKSLHGVRV